jgi:hypothetical protein
MVQEDSVNSGSNLICFELDPLAMFFEYVSELRDLFILFIKSLYQT